MVNVVAKDEPDKRVLLMGNEAIARGAVEADVKVVASYPGSPATQITETLLEVAPELGFHAEWSTNEKVAFDIAGGAALTGMRSFTAMKNAGLAWCVDMLTTITYGGVRGGFVICVADDPHPRISSSAHDCRFTGMDAEILVLEPAYHQEAKDMTKLAFEYSEKLEEPVMVRPQYRLCYSVGDITLGKIDKLNRSPVFDKHWKLPFRWNIYGLQQMTEKHGIIHSKFPMMKQISEENPYNTLTINGSELGIIGSGVGAAFALEALQKLGIQDKVSFLKTACAYPIPEKKMSQLFNQVEKVLVVEDGEPVVELQARALAQDVSNNVKIYGKSRNRVLPEVGDLNLPVVENAISELIGLPKREVSSVERVSTKASIRQMIIPRSMGFCSGCPHTATWWAVRSALRRTGAKIGKGVPIINGDIGCYEQAGFGLMSRQGIYKASFAETSVRYADEYLSDTVDTNNIMGGGIGFAQGQFWTGYNDGLILAVTGDSTFFHACIPSLINAVWNKAKFPFIILDNSWTAMTGHQPHPGTGMVGVGEQSKEIKIEEICKACGVENIRIVDSYDVVATRDAIEDAIKSNEFSVVISRRKCALQALRRKELGKRTYEVDQDLCVGCRECIRLGCPALNFDYEGKKARIGGEIAALSCLGCGVCEQVCPSNAIKMKGDSK